jgi:hypothetical protein
LARHRGDDQALQSFLAGISSRHRLLPVYALKSSRIFKIASDCSVSSISD